MLQSLEGAAVRHWVITCCDELAAHRRGLAEALVGAALDGAALREGLRRADELATAGVVDAGGRGVEAAVYAGGVPGNVLLVGVE